MRNLYDRIVVLLKAAPTYLTAVALVVGILLEQLPELPFGLPAWLTPALAGIVTTIGVAVIIIRRVTPVLEDARGLLPADGPTTAAERELLERVGELPPPTVPPNWRDEFA